MQAAGCRGFSVSVTVMWQWRGGNRNQKACNVSPRCLDKKKKENIEFTARNASGHIKMEKEKIFLEKHSFPEIHSYQDLFIRFYILI